MVTMKSRKITLNYRNVTGQNGSVKSDYSAAESTLEADFFTLLDFNKNVIQFSAQPVTISCNQKDLRQHYTPDVKVEFTNKKIIFYEVKYRNDLFENWAFLKPKFKAAIKYAKHNGAEFKIITEKEIRTAYLKNIKFLKPYVSSLGTDIKKCSVVEKIIINLKTSTPNELIQILTMINWLLDNYPIRLQEQIENSGIMPSLLHMTRDYKPFWYYSQIVGVKSVNF